MAGLTVDQTVAGISQKRPRRPSLACGM